MDESPQHVAIRQRTANEVARLRRVLSRTAQLLNDEEAYLEQLETEAGISAEKRTPKETS